MVVELITPDQKRDPGYFFYPQALGATLHPIVRQLLMMNNAELASRYCGRHSEANETVLIKLMNSTAKFYRWAGADLIKAVDLAGSQKMIVIEMNSCPSGNKSVPYKGWGFEGFRRVMANAVVPLLANTCNAVPNGGLAVFYDVKKQRNESMAYATMLSQITNENVYLVDVGHDFDLPPFLKWSHDGVCQLEVAPGEWREIRAVFRYVTRRPWVKLPLLSKTLVVNPVVACLAGGRNKLLAAKAYAIFNARYAEAGLQIHIPLTITDVTKNAIPAYAQQMNNQLVVKVPYSNCGVGVYTITSTKELDEFMQVPHVYDKFVVQGLISHKDWPSSNSVHQLYHVGCRPKCDPTNTYVNDLRFMICSSPNGWMPVALYSRRSAEPLKPELSYPSWEMLGTNLSMGEDGTSGTDTSRLLLLNDETFADLGLSLDDLIESYVQTVLAASAVEDLCQQLMPSPGVFNLPLFMQLDEDRALLQEIARGCVQIMDLHPELHSNHTNGVDVSSSITSSSANESTSSVVNAVTSTTDEPSSPSKWPASSAPLLRYKV